ncbi:MAG: hypothetical protein SGI71_13285 [Verrucomicrobiota bacterium]|nr:hypothetical protein [Verrucomicrobiota bacterium]
MKSFLPVLLFVIAFLQLPNVQAVLIRERGVVYLEELPDGPPQYKIIEDSAIFAERQLKLVVGSLQKNRTVELLGWSDEALLVQTKSPGKFLRGWITHEAMQLVKTSDLEKWKTFEETRLRHLELIKNHEIDVGMSAAEVLKSIGKPESKSKLKEESMIQEVWRYVKYEKVARYETVADAFGRLQQQIVYIKTPVGTRTVVFVDGFVKAIDEQVNDSSSSNFPPDTYPTVPYR